MKSFDEEIKVGMYVQHKFRPSEKHLSYKVISIKDECVYLGNGSFFWFKGNCVKSTKLVDKFKMWVNTHINIV